jgi:hypothetical protein
MRTARWTTTTILGLALLASPDAGRAQGSVKLTPFAGGTIFMNQPAASFTLARPSGPDLLIADGRYQDGLTVGAFAGMHFGARWEIEALLAWTPSRLEASDGLRGGSAAADAYIYGLGVNFHLPRYDRVVPYVTLGMGAETWRYDIPNVSAETHLMADLGGGIEFPVKDRTVLRLDVRDCVSWSAARAGAAPDATSHLMILTGVSFTFPSR